jgi:hypothetical protein
VARTWCRARRSSSRGVTAGLGPSSNVSATDESLPVTRSVRPKSCACGAAAPHANVPAAAATPAPAARSTGSADIISGEFSHATKVRASHTHPLGGVLTSRAERPWLDEISAGRHTRGSANAAAFFPSIRSRPRSRESFSNRTQHSTIARLMRAPVPCWAKFLPPHSGLKKKRISTLGRIGDSTHPFEPFSVRCDW